LCKGSWRIRFLLLPLHLNLPEGNSPYEPPLPSVEENNYPPEPPQAAWAPFVPITDSYRGIRACSQAQAECLLLVVSLLEELDDIGVADLHGVGEGARIVHGVCRQGGEILWLGSEHIEVGRDPNLLAQ